MNAELKDKVLFLEGRLSFPKFAELQYSDDDLEKKHGKYNMNLILEPGYDLGPLKKLVQNALKDKFKELAKPLFEANKLKLPYKTGAEMLSPDGTIYDGYSPDGFSVSANFYNPMEFLTIYNQHIMSNSKEAEDVFYAGCYVKIAVSAHGYDQGGGKGANLRLIGLLKKSEGEKFASGIVIAADELFAGEEFQTADLPDVGGAATSGGTATSGDEW